MKLLDGGESQYEILWLSFYNCGPEGRKRTEVRFDAKNKETGKITSQFRRLKQWGEIRYFNYEWESYDVTDEVAEHNARIKTRKDKNE